MRPGSPSPCEITGAAWLVALGVLGFVAQAEYQQERRQLVDKLVLRLQHIAQTGALFVDGEA